MKSETDYHLIRSKERKRTISLQIMPDGRVVMRAPSRTPQEEIDSFFKAKSTWVEKKLSEREGVAEGSAGNAKRFISGEKFLYLGEWYPLEIQSRNGRDTPLVLSWSRFTLDEDRAGEARTLFIQWYKGESKRLFFDRVNHYGRRLNLFPQGIKITSAQFRYGSCSPKDTLSFSWKLIMAPLTVIDYIIVHELMHIREKNHSKRYWSLVAAAMPDYKRHKIWLKNNHYLLRI